MTEDLYEFCYPAVSDYLDSVGKESCYLLFGVVPYPEVHIEEPSLASNENFEWAYLPDIRVDEIASFVHYDEQTIVDYIKTGPMDHPVCGFEIIEVFNRKIAQRKAERRAIKLVQ